MEYIYRNLVELKRLEDNWRGCIFDAFFNFAFLDYSNIKENKTNKTVYMYTYIYYIHCFKFPARFRSFSLIWSIKNYVYKYTRATFRIIMIISPMVKDLITTFYIRETEAECKVGIRNALRKLRTSGRDFDEVISMAERGIAFETFDIATLVLPDYCWKTLNEPEPKTCLTVYIIVI